MSIDTRYVKSVDELKAHILKGEPSVYVGSRTSTVMPYDKLEEHLGSTGPFSVVDLSQMPSKMEMDDDGALFVEGAVSWDEANQFVRSKGRALMTYPTENLALILSGIATSATGERCFGFGTLRDQVISVSYLDHQANLSTKKCSSPFLTSDAECLSTYQKDYERYKGFKNAPCPRFSKASDLLVGTEGQMGVIISAKIKTAPLDPVSYLFVAVDRWEDDFKAHVEIVEKVQSFRGQVLSCELLDSSCLGYLDPEIRPANNKDVIFLEILTREFENVYEQFLLKLEYCNEEDFFEISEKKFHQVRVGVPRAIFEDNSKRAVVKQGTDAQVRVDQLGDLFESYRQATKQGVPYGLFGHIGDCHLHFNFMPTTEQLEPVYKYMDQFYSFIKDSNGSPFAEHGIGLLKKPYIKEYYGSAQIALFKVLKAEHDPSSIFFPQGFMNS
ncbi:MAG: FAD-binding oxidoreductase [Bacteriovoracaceae bacterium]|jgi:FAD/FMN-containing dehydrogenase|nr:FAD-binding oxidoreductase [Bacteriovoracaceae bacterium]